MKKIAATLLCLLMVSFGAVAEEVSSAKKALINELLEQTGQSSIALGKQFSTVFVQQMTAVLKQSNPSLDPKAYTIVEEEITAIMNEEFTTDGAFSQVMYPIYAKHFSEKELQQMIDLNNTELGQKMIRVMPQISQEGMAAGQTFGAELAPRIQQRLVERFEEEGIVVN